MHLASLQAHYFMRFTRLTRCGNVGENHAEDIYRTKRWIVLIMERLEGGELFEQIAAWSWNNWVGREGRWSAGRGMVDWQLGDWSTASTRFWLADLTHFLENEPTI